MHNIPSTYTYTYTHVFKFGNEFPHLKYSYLFLIGVERGFGVFTCLINIKKFMYECDEEKNLI